MPRYRLRTLLTLLAVGPPILAAAWLARNDPGIVLVTSLWCATFAASVTYSERTVRHFGLTVAEWLVILAVVVVLSALLMPSPSLEARTHCRI
jgi:disulfide bond formation protein DsbB